jgi:Na+/melibiose symporter-like transporter
MLKKQVLPLITAQALLCFLSAYLISKISLIGKIGIAVFYKEYKWLRSGWKTFLVFFTVQLIVIGVLYFLHRKRSKKATVYTAAGIMAVALTGLWFTYNDFLHTYSHRLLKERFHMGFYLFWLGMIGTCVFFLVLSALGRQKIIIEQKQLLVEQPGSEK